MGEIYLGHGDIPPDYAKAIDSFLRATKLADADALYRLGVVHARGHGVPRDYLEAYKWFDLSVGLARLGEDRDEAMRARDAIRENMTPAQVSEAAQRAEDWLATLMQQPHDEKYGVKWVELPHPHRGR